MPNANTNLHAAKKAKNDEFYTRLEDIENELRHYKHHFRGKTVLCNCDDPRVSNFFRYFALNFETFGLKRLIATCYKNQDADLFSQHDSEKAVYIIYEGDRNGNGVPDLSEIEVKPLQGDGNFRSPECVELLKQADIVCTNPPFSLFREYVAQLMKYEKKFLIVTNKGAISYKEIFPYIKDNKMWIGHTPMGYDMKFYLPEKSIQEIKEKKKEGSAYVVINGEIMGRSPSCWLTNLDIPKRHEDIILFREYTPEAYSKYDNYDAIEVSKVVDIPKDYDGVMGVPITFIDKYNPEQFEIIGNAGDMDAMKQLGARPIGQNNINRLRKQGNRAHVTANMVSLCLVTGGGYFCLTTEFSSENYDERYNDTGIRKIRQAIS